MPGGVAGQSPIMKTPYADRVVVVTVGWFQFTEAQLKISLSGKSFIEHRYELGIAA
jgi:hypothetical protein